MPTEHRSSLFLGAAVALAAIVLAPRIQAAPDIFSWNSSTYTYNAAQPTAVTAAGAVNGNAISVQFGTGSYFANNTDHATTNVTIPANPAVGTYGTAGTTGTSALYTDGGSTGNKALQILADFDNSAGNILSGSSISVTVFFSKPVSNLMFSFYDVDNGTVNGSPYNDLVSGILGTGAGGATVRPMNLAGGATNTATLDASNSKFTASGNNNQNSAGGNASVTFGSTPISSFTFVYSDTAAAGSAHSTLQIIALGDLTFNTVPEPSTWACLAVAGGLGIWKLRRRARRVA